MLQKHYCCNADQSQVKRNDQSCQFECVRQNCLVDISLDDKNEAVDDDGVDIEEDILRKDTNERVDKFNEI